VGKVKPEKRSKVVSKAVGGPSPPWASVAPGEGEVEGGGEGGEVEGGGEGGEDKESDVGTNGTAAGWP
jgi:hypothetical protein